MGTVLIGSADDAGSTTPKHSLHLDDHDLFGAVVDEPGLRVARCV